MREAAAKSGIKLLIQLFNSRDLSRTLVEEEEEESHTFVLCRLQSADQCTLRRILYTNL